uniref:Uncharacterized protein n=1 Tax=Pithovirus LCPAC104 TaxID=2506589 RepID=A0A481Z6D5_9VIRU|nr:MAG: hypothetical protein LCPAC104_01470 [Pithovirus LCPAC104]
MENQFPLYQNRYYNDNYLYIITGVAHKSQLKESLEKAIRRFGYPCNYKINFVISKDRINGKESYCGYAYVWLSNTTVAYALTGRELNGSERVEYVDDPDWTPPIKNINELYEDEINKISPMSSDSNQHISDFLRTTPCPFDKMTSWADIMDIEEEVQKKTKSPKIKKILEPLLELPKYYYDKEQLSHFNENLKKENISENGGFKIDRAFVRISTDINVKTSTIVGSNIPDWITEEILLEEFSRYVTKNSKIKYPLISFKKSIKYKANIVYINFQQDTYDGQFALLMSKKLHITSKENENLNCKLYFNHFQTNR